MKYHWTDCPGCHCHVAINYSESASGVSGSLRRWSTDRSVNDGRPILVGAAELPAGGGFGTTCVCGRAISVPAEPDAVSAERETDFRVTLKSE